MPKVYYDRLIFSGVKKEEELRLIPIFVCELLENRLSISLLGNSWEETESKEFQENGKSELLRENNFKRFMD